MIVADKGTEDGTELRQRALARAQETPSLAVESLGAQSPEAIGQMLHELHVHQIELEIQNEELRRAQEELEISRTRYFEIYDLAPVGYCSIDETGKILQANLCAAELFGVTRGVLVSQSFSRFILKEDQDRYYLLRKRLFDTHEPQWCDLHFVKDDGTPFWAQLAATLAYKDSGAPILRVVLNDISERKRVEAERSVLDHALQDKNGELEIARSVADKANLAKSEFLSSMSHELRTPLGAILGFAQLMESGSTPPTLSQRRSIDQILKAGWYLLELINEILDLALIESGKLSLLVEAVSLAEVMLECATIIESQAQKHGIRLTFPQFDAPCVISADHTRIKQVLINLLSNAIKYNTEGGAVIVTCALGGSNAIRISVSDTGAGLTSDQMAQLFQPFNRLGQESGAEQGTGIGLVVCKRLVELMGGVISVDSTVGKGSIFCVELKLTAIDQAEAHATQSAALVPEDRPASASQGLVLYVEDNPANLMLVEDIIGRRADLRFLSAGDALSGIELARSEQPHVILMDINLPGISGLEALKILARHPDTAHIPVLALSANAMPHDIEKGLAAGFFRYLTKPIKINEFLVAIDDAMTLFVTNRASPSDRP